MFKGNVIFNTRPIIAYFPINYVVITFVCTEFRRATSFRCPTLPCIKCQTLTAYRAAHASKLLSSVPLSLLS